MREQMYYVFSDIDPPEHYHDMEVFWWNVLTGKLWWSTFSVDAQDGYVGYKWATRDTTMRGDDMLGKGDYVR
jgi:hypothetical protein